MNRTTPVADASASVDRSFDRLVRQLILRMRATTGLEEEESLWRRIEAADLDADGTIDTVTIESVTGELWVFRLVR